MQAPGSDTDGREYTSPSEMWAAESGDAAARQQWYSKAVDYWAGQPETYDGVLGGYGHVSPVEVRDSAAFLKKVRSGVGASLCVSGERRERNGDDRARLAEGDGWGPKALVGLSRAA
eukprot:jgi/Tetstr1/460144/TSEL_005460.t1